VKKSIFHYTNYRVYLADVYRRMKSERNACSHRFIEQRVGISQGYFSRILKGTKNISDKVILKFIDFLKLSKNEVKFFENLVKYTQADNQEIKSMYYARMVALASPSVVPLAKEQFAYFNELHHVAIRALVNMAKIDGQADFDAFGKLLVPPVSGVKIKESLQLLEKLKLIEKNETGIYRVTNRIISTGNHPNDLVIRTYLQNSMRQAIDALNTVSEKERKASIMTISVSMKTYDQIIELLDATRQEINKLVENETDATRIYQLSLNLIPLSKHIREDVSDED
jgi:uncharacterized protein (TIGR02147 family)